MRRREFVGLMGGAAAWPLMAQAQQAKPVIGFLSSGAPEQSAEALKAFSSGLGEGGFVEGRNVAIEFRWGDGYDRLAAMASDLVQRKVMAIVAAGGVPSAKAAKAATDTIPIIFNVGADPVAFGIVSSLNRPGGNITGVTNLNLELGQKRLELLHEMIPDATRIALLVNPITPLAESMAKDLATVAGSMGLELHIERATSEQEIENAFAAFKEWRAGALVIGADAYFGARSEQLAALATRDALAAIGSFPRFARAGGLMCYGGNPTEQWHLLGLYTARVLSGEKPADLPVQQSTNVELVINLKAAKALGIAVPMTLLGRADEVIE
jgi:putative tryptophan/tyrosine transport system substrate-binding protein